MDRIVVQDAARGGPRLYWDCSMTARSTSQAGVQRVVRNVAASASAIAKQFGFESHTVIYRDGKWRDSPTALDRVRQCNASNGSSNPTENRQLASWTRRLADRAYKIAYPRSLVRSIRRIGAQTLGLGGPSVDFQPDDILMLLDASWLEPEQPRVEAARRAGARVGMVVYDLLPICHSQYMLPKSRRQFDRWLRQIVPNTDFFIAISRTVRDEFRDWVRKEFPTLNLPDERITWFSLGVKLDLLSSTGSVRPAVQAVFDGGGPAYVKIATLDPRKNHAALLDAFELIWREIPTARLCFAGRRGWMFRELVQRIETHPRLGKQLFWFSDLSDAEISYALNHASGALFASLAEGYGLPIAEALQHGLPTFVSDIPVHREVGNDFCAWFDPRRPETLASLIVAHIRTSAYPAHRSPREYRPTTWSKSTHLLIESSVQLARQAASFGAVCQHDAIPKSVHFFPLPLRYHG